MNDDQAKALRAPFPADVIGKLPARGAAEDSHLCVAPSRIAEKVISIVIPNEVRNPSTSSDLDHE